MTWTMQEKNQKRRENLCLSSSADKDVPLLWPHAGPWSLELGVRLLQPLGSEPWGPSHEDVMIPTPEETGVGAPGVSSPWSLRCSRIKDGDAVLASPSYTMQGTHT